MPKSQSSPPIWLKTLAYSGLVFLHFPIVFILINAFVEHDGNNTYFTLKWFSAAFARDDVMSAILLSLKVAAVATFLALIMGTMAAAALYRRNFFGKEAITTMLILPIALPGIITGIALLSAMSILAIEPGFWTIVVSHATFCVVIIYNNVVARFRRMPHSLVEASMDLGADGFTTFRRIILPQLATALLAGGLLAFALSFDELIVTNNGKLDEYDHTGLGTREESGLRTSLLGTEPRRCYPPLHSRVNNLQPSRVMFLVH